MGRYGTALDEFTTRKPRKYDVFDYITHISAVFVCSTVYNNHGLPSTAIHCHCFSLFLDRASILLNRTPVKKTEYLKVTSKVIVSKVIVSKVIITKVMVSKVIITMYQGYGYQGDHY